MILLCGLSRPKHRLADAMCSPRECVGFNVPLDTYKIGNFGD